MKNYDQMVDYISNRLFELQKQHRRNAQDSMSYLNPVDIKELELLTRLDNENSNRYWGSFEFPYESLNRENDDICKKLDRVCDTAAFDIEIFEKNYGEYTGPYQKLERLRDLFRDLFPQTDFKLVRLYSGDEPAFTYREELPSSAIPRGNFILEPTSDDVIRDLNPGSDDRLK